MTVATTKEAAAKQATKIATRRTGDVVMSAAEIREYSAVEMAWFVGYTLN